MELSFSLSELNKKSAYRLESAGLYSFSFVTSQGKKYEIGFIQDMMISDEGVFQFFISTEDKFKTTLDKNVQQTIKVVIEQFFCNREAVLDYICDTADNRQAARSRLFHNWFETYMDKTKYYMRTLHAEMDGSDYYAAVLMRRDNPRYALMNEAIDRFVSDFQDKP